MSRLGKKPIEIPDGVEVKAEGGDLHFKGKNGELSLKVLPFLKLNLEGKQLSFSLSKDNQQARANWGTMVALAKNAVVGVTEGFSKTMIIEGVGFRAKIEGSDLILNVGFSHPVKFTPDAKVKIEVEKNNIKVSGVNRGLVGETAAKIRKIKKPEPYKGKGIKYVGEVIRRKAGKKAVGSSG